MMVAAMLLMMFGLGRVVFGFRCSFSHFLRFGFFVHKLLFRMLFVFAVCRSNWSQYQTGSCNHQKQWTNINGFDCQLLSAFGEICSNFGNRSMATQ